MKADFHCHTKATKKGEKGRDVAPDVFAKNIEQAEVKIVAITNHNQFDYEQYLALSESVRGIASVWPGVELDVTGDSKQKWHVLVLCSPSKAEKFNAAVQDLTSGFVPKNFVCEFSEAWESLVGLNTLFISHCHDKDPAISEADIASIIDYAGSESWRLFFEPRKLLTLGIWSNHGRSMLIGSDVKDWSRYQESNFSNIRLNVDSFEQFCLLARRDVKVVETLLSNKDKTLMRAKPHSSVDIELPIFNDVNVIFGQKGTGKTEIIKSLCSEYDRLGIVYSKYIGGEKYSEYEKLLSTENEERSQELFNRKECEDDIALLLDWSENQPTPLSEYKKWYQTKGNSAKKDRFRLSDSQKMPEKPEDTYQEHKSNAKTVGDFRKAFVENELSGYLNTNDSTQLQSLLQKLHSSIEEKKRSEFIEVTSGRMANSALDSIKSIIDRKSDTKSKPSSTGFIEFVEGRIRVLKAADRILGAICPAEKVEKSYLGSLEDKGKLFIVVRHRYLTASSKTDEFSIGIQKLKKWKKSVETIHESAFSPDLPEKMSSFIDVNEEVGLSSLSDFIGITKYAVLGDSESPYTPSDGEKGILVIERKLREKASAYLLDEPELGMSNLYIDKVIRPILQNRAAEGKTVIISTHNANLAVRTLPYCSIYREHVEGDTYRTYIGNPFTNRLVDIEDDNNTINWAETSMAILEGGSEAFLDRKMIYEAGESCR